MSRRGLIAIRRLERWHFKRLIARPNNLEHKFIPHPAHSLPFNFIRRHPRTAHSPSHSGDITVEHLDLRPVTDQTATISSMASLYQYKNPGQAEEFPSPDHGLCTSKIYRSLDEEAHVQVAIDDLSDGALDPMWFSEAALEMSNSGIDDLYLPATARIGFGSPEEWPNWPLVADERSTCQLPFKDNHFRRVRRFIVVRGPPYALQCDQAGFPTAQRIVTANPGNISSPSRKRAGSIPIPDDTVAHMSTPCFILCTNKFDGCSIPCDKHEHYRTSE
ncbi:hypothetical protein NX059_000628 [Plenodomus lindquistii]|nr:hypothetical protein NX059_000628 [Plenodomus lindquistii]